jgi:hypothetical protein
MTSPPCRQSRHLIWLSPVSYLPSVRWIVYNSIMVPAKRSARTGFWRSSAYTSLFLMRPRVKPCTSIMIKKSTSSVRNIVSRTVQNVPEHGSIICNQGIDLLYKVSVASSWIGSSRMIKSALAISIIELEKVEVINIWHDTLISVHSTHQMKYNILEHLKVACQQLQKSQLQE